MKTFLPACPKTFIILMGFLLLFSSSLFAQKKVPFTPGTHKWIAPLGVTKITLQAWGGGGAGGGATKNGTAGGGGGGGAYVLSTILVTPGTEYTIVVGAGGVASTGVGGKGANTTFSLGGTTYLAAIGGEGGGAGSGSNGFGGSGGTGGTYNGGNGANGNGGINYGGGGGSGAGTGNAGNNGNIPNGGAGVSGGGTGGNGANAGNANTPGQNGNSPGGGGGGAFSRNADVIGGTGGAGQLILSYYLLTNTSVAGAVCQGSPAAVTLTAAAADLPAGTYTVQYSLSGNITEPNLSATMTVSPAGVGKFNTINLANSGNTTITIISITDGILDGSVATGGNTSTITVNPPPVVKITAAETSGNVNDDGIICVGASATLTATGGGTYSWSPVASNAATLNVTPGVTTTYTVTVTGANNCVASSNYTVTVNPLAIVNAGAALPAICQGGTSAALGGSFSGNATGAVWSASVAGGTFANNGGATPGTTTYTPDPAFTGTITLTLKATGGSCGEPVATKTLLVNAIPIVDAGMDIPAICQGGTTTALGGSFGGGATGAVWSASVAGGTFANNGGATPGTTTYTPPANYSGDIILSLTTTGGNCSTKTTTKTVKVSPAPTANAGAALPAICQGGTTTALGGSFGGGATGAVWSDGGAGGTFTGNDGNSPNTTTYKPDPSFTGTVTLTLTTNGGSCGTNTVSKNLVVNPLATVASGAALPAICQGGTTTALGGSFGGGATGAVWSASVAGGTFANNGGATPGTTTYTPPANYSGVITLTLTSTGGGCGVATADKILSVNQRPVVTFTAKPGTSACTGSELTYTTQAGETNYTWNVQGTANVDYTITAGGIGSTQNSVTIKWLTAGDKTVTVNYTNSDGCAAQAVASHTTKIVLTPTLSGVSASTTGICSGNSATITLNGLLANTQFVINYAINSGTSLSATVNANASGVGTFTTNALSSSESGGTLVITGIEHTGAGSGCVFVPTANNQATLPQVQDVTLVAPKIAKSPNVASVCAGEKLTVTLTAPGSGGSASAVDQYRFSTNNSSSWSAWDAQIPDLTSVVGTTIIESRRYDPGSTGCNISGSETETWIVVAQPVVTAPSPATQTVCTGSVVTPLSVTALGGTGTFTYQWYANTANSNSGGTLIGGAQAATYTPPVSAEGTKYYYCVVSQSGVGCKEVASATATVIVVAQPVAQDITPNVSEGNICAGQVLSASFSGGSGGAGSISDSYEFSTNGGSSFATYTEGTAIPTVALAGKTVIIRSKRIASGDGCSESVPKTVSWTVIPALVSGTLTKNITATSVCAGTAVSATATQGTGGAGSISDLLYYRVDGNAWQPYTSGSPIATAGHSSVEISTYRTASATGCSQSSPTVVSWTINPLPVPNILVEENFGIANDGTICTNGSVKLTASGGSTYAWSSGQTGAAINVAPTANTTYTVTATANNCSATASTTISINPLPTPTFVTTPGATVCEGTDVTYTTQAGQSNYQWNFTGTAGTNYSITSGGNPSSSSVTIKWLTPGTKTVTVIYTNTNGCTATIPASVQTSVTARPNTPTITAAENSGLAVNDGKICAGTPIVLTAASTTPNVTYLWSPGGATTQSISVSPANTTTYSVTVTANNCASTANYTVTVTQPPASVTLVGPEGMPTFCYTNQTINLSIPSTQPGYKYRLQSINYGPQDPVSQFTDLVNPGNGGPLIIPMKPQNKRWCYRVDITSPDGCYFVTNEVCPTLPPESNMPNFLPVCPGITSTSLTVTLTDAKSVKWQISTNGGSTWNDITVGGDYSISTATNFSTTTLTINNITPAMSGHRFRILMGAQPPCFEIPSGVVTLIFNTTTSIDVTNIPAASYCQGATPAALSLTASGTNLTYQWYRDTNNDAAGGTLIPGATSATYTPPTTTPGTYYYYVVVTGACGTLTSASSGAIVVNAPTAITTQPTSGVVGGGPVLYCQEATSVTPLSVTGTGVNLTYQWYSNTANSNSGGTAIQGATNATFTPPATTAGTVYYYVVVTGTCGVVPSNVVGVSVVRPPELPGFSSLPPQCYGKPVTLSILPANPGDVTGYQWYKDNQPIPGATSNSFTIPSMMPANAGTYYVMVAGKTPCSSVRSGDITLTTYTSDITTWTAGANTDEWHQIMNWTCGIPDLYKDAVIPIVSNNTYPYIDNAPDTGGRVRNLLIETGGPFLRVDGLLKIAGNITNNGKIDAYRNGVNSIGTLEFVNNTNYYAASGGYPGNGNNSAPLTLGGSAAQGDTRTQHLKISNLVNLTVPLDVYGQLSFTASNRNLATGDKLTLKSVSSTVSAMIMDRTNGTGTEQNNVITGQVTVERFIDGAQGRKWRLVTAPVKGISINQAWQEGMTMNNSAHKITGTNTAATPSAKFGTLITGGAPNYTTAGTANAAGFDFWDAIANAQSSIRTYAGNADWKAAIWQPIASTITNNFEGNNSYLLFVRGDRSITTSSGGTVLRPKGLLKENLTHPFTVIGGQSHTLIGNPYASPLNFHNIYLDNVNAIQPYFWIWQASLTASWGGYAVIRPIVDGSPTYEMVPDGATAGQPVQPVISSGQGFFLVPKTVGVSAPVTIKQTHKHDVNASVSVFREAGNVPKKLFVNVYAPATVGGEEILLDGALAEFSPGSKPKGLTKALQNGENLSVRLNDRDYIVSTTDQPEVGDTVHLRLWNTTHRAYKLRVRSANFTAQGLAAILVDKFLQKETPLNLGDAITEYSFNRTGQSASGDEKRFVIVFRSAPLPVVTLEATEKRAGVQLQWQVPEEVNVAHYELERSTDGTTFATISTTPSQASAAPKQYTHFDKEPFIQVHYRVKLTGISGATVYSNTVTVNLVQPSGFTVYPNPVLGRTANLRFTTKPEGRYNVQLFAPGGQQVASQVIQHMGGTATYELPVGKLASGTYTAEIHHPGGRKEKVKLVITH